VVRVDGHGIGVQFDEAVQELLDAAPDLGV
jgi:hypothetical protein